MLSARRVQLPLSITLIQIFLKDIKKGINIVDIRRNIQLFFKMIFSFTEKNVSMAVQFKCPGRKRIW